MDERGFPLGDVCTFLGIKPHVLRYWEQEIPLVSPRRSRTGRRVYTWSDLDILFRVRHLLQDRGYTIAGARDRIWEESTGEAQDVKALIAAVRAELFRLMDKAREVRERLETAEGAPPEGEGQ